MNYRHSYHAGNFAEVCKHNILILLLNYLTRKETPFCYVETHAGRGNYDLSSVEAQKSKEYQEGIKLLLKAHSLSTLLQNYLDHVLSFNNTSVKHLSLRYYPGSPSFANRLMRPQDKGILMELHQEDMTALRRLFAKNKQIAVHHVDGYQGLKAFLPPQEKRGMVFIDPPFETKTEFSQLIQAVKTINQRWSQCMIAIWYPIKARHEIDWFHQQLQQSGVKKILAAELCILPDDVVVRLNGSGMIIVNPPWQLEQTLTELLGDLSLLLTKGKPQKPEVKWLVTE